MTYGSFRRKLPWVHRLFAMLIMAIAQRAGPFLIGNESGARNETGSQPGDIGGSLVTRRVEDLHAHPSYVKSRLAVPAFKLDALAKLGDLAFCEPMVIACSGVIVDGYARFELAKLQNRQTLTCIEYDWTDEQALQSLLRMQRRSSTLSDFARVLLALQLEPSFKEKAQANQRIGGQNKGSSKLTEAAAVDVRSALAHEAAVCEGNITKVKQLMRNAHPEILEALRSGEIRIHRGWKLCEQSPEKQMQALMLYRSKRGIGKTIRNLIARLKPRPRPSKSDLARLTRLLSALNSGELGSINVLVVKVTGKAVYLTEELVAALDAQEELTFE